MATHLLRPTALVRDDQLVEGEGVLVEDGRIVEVGSDLSADTEEALEGTLLPGAIGVVRQEGRVYAGQGNEIPQELGDRRKFSHGRKGS